MAVNIQKQTSEISNKSHGEHSHQVDNDKKELESPNEKFPPIELGGMFGKLKDTTSEPLYAAQEDEDVKNIT